jgi:tetratricopeptide (TPR) repeat protein
LPLIGLYVAAVALATRAAWPRRAWVLAATSVVAVYAAVGFVQVSYWHDGVRLFRHTLAVTRDNAVARQGLASALFRKGEFAKALAHLEQAATIDPGDRQPPYTVGRILFAQGRCDEAAGQFLSALAIDADFAEAHHDLGRVLCAQGKYWEAQGHFERAIQLDPQLVQGYANLGYVCYHLGDYAGSISFNERALALDAGLIACHRSIAASLVAEGRISEAIEKFRYVARVLPEDEEVRAEITRLLERQAALAEKGPD